MKMARLGILIEKSEAEKRWNYGINVFGVYICEVFRDAGIPFQTFDNVQEAVNSSLDMLVTVLESDREETTSLLWNFVESGGALISYAGLHKFLGKLGCTAARSYGSGYANVSEYAVNDKLRFISSFPWAAAAEAPEGVQVSVSGTVYKDQPSGAEIGSALLRFKAGRGTIDRWSVNIPETIVGLQQGTSPVLKDGNPSSDGMGAINEGILKTDDAFALDWEWDRAATETGQPYFHTPYADLWREVLISHLLRTAADRGTVLPFVDEWPDDVQCVAMISHDSDFNIDESAEVTLEQLRQKGVQTTWCMMEPGFSAPYYDRIREDGHELAFHYNAMDNDNGFWAKDEFSRQLNWLRGALGTDDITSNKNHFTRFEGWGEFFEWCESEGIESDQSFGPSKRGNIGFIFGTCRPYFPIAWSNRNNRTYDVTEICYQTPDLDMGSWADSSIMEPFLQQIKRVRGVAHIVFHQYHLYTKPNTANAMFRYIDTARSYGFEFWTGKQINDWVRLRRDVVIKGLDEHGRPIYEPGTAPKGLRAWVPVLTEPGQALSDEVTVKRYGMLCRKV